jgi:two-component system phosphate regulon sensor histidine kinase PhoR
VDLAALVRHAVEAARPLASKSGVTLELDAPEHLGALLDEQRVRQVADNLLSNAVKYSRHGGSVFVTLRQTPETVELEVRDTGIGIAPGEAAHVFDRFFRGGEALRNKIPGTGLGLNIISSIVSAHGGEVSLESEVGRGSTFRVTLPHRDG